MNQTFKVWDSQHNSLKRYTPKKLYKIVVVYPITDRELEFIGMDRGSCIMQAEVAKEVGDDIMFMRSEEEITVLQKEKV